MIPRHEADLYVFAHNVGAGSTKVQNSAGNGPAPRDVYTIGMRLKSLPGQFHGWDYGTELAGQVGSVNVAGTRLDHEAFAADVSGGRSWAEALGAPRFGVNFTYGSGDGNPNDKSNGTFDLLFGAAHKFYGLMDVTGLRNTLSPSFNLTVKPVKSVTVRADYFLFWLADTHDLSYAEIGKGRTANGYGLHPSYSSFLGSEFDLLVNYMPRPWLALQAGYSHFFVGDYLTESLERVTANGGAVDADYFFVLAKLNF